MAGRPGVHLLVCFLFVTSLLGGCSVKFDSGARTLLAYEQSEAALAESLAKDIKRRNRQNDQTINLYDNAVVGNNAMVQNITGQINTASTFGGVTITEQSIHDNGTTALAAFVSFRKNAEQLEGLPSIDPHSVENSGLLNQPRPIDVTVAVAAGVEIAKAVYTFWIEQNKAERDRVLTYFKTYQLPAWHELDPQTPSPPPPQK